MKKSFCSICFCGFLTILNGVFFSQVHAASAPPLRTGQTTLYETGDDGDLQKGVAWSNLRFSDNGDGSVTDNLTGLIWLKDANCFGSQNWSTALASANALADGQCGLSDGSVAGDWHLPNRKELYSLVDYGHVPNLPAGHPFANAQSGTYYSSTTRSYDTSYAWHVNFSYGFVNVNAKSVSFSVWPVRDGQ